MLRFVRYWSWCVRHEREHGVTARTAARGWRTWTAFCCGRPWLPAACCAAMHALADDASDMNANDRIEVLVYLLDACGETGPSVPERLSRYAQKSRSVPVPDRELVRLSALLQTYGEKHRQKRTEAAVTTTPLPSSSQVSTKQLVDAIDSRFREDSFPPPWDPTEVQQRLLADPPPETLLMNHTHEARGDSWPGLIRHTLELERPKWSEELLDTWSAFLDGACLVLHPLTRYHMFVALMRLEGSGDGLQVRMRVRRDMELEDSLPLASPTVDLKHALHVAFVDRHGNQEDGEDVGGVLREYFERFWDKVAANGFLQTSPSGSLVPCDHDVSAQLPEGMPRHDFFFFLGRALGKCVRENICAPRLAPYVWHQICVSPPERVPPLQLLREHDAELAQRLANLYLSTPEDLKRMELPCCVTVRRFAEAPRDVPLWPEGDTETVSQANLDRYVAAVAAWHTRDRFEPRLRHISEGFHSVVERRNLTDRFAVDEFVALFCGTTRALLTADILPWLTHHEGGTDQDASDLRESLRALEMSRGEGVAERFLRFVTGTGTVSDLGLGALWPPLSVHWTPEKGRLASACTCANTLFLPSASGAQALQGQLEFVLYDCGDDWGFHLA